MKNKIIKIAFSIILISTINLVEGNKFFSLIIAIIISHKLFIEIINLERKIVKIIF